MIIIVFSETERQRETEREAERERERERQREKAFKEKCNVPGADQKILLLFYNNYFDKKSFHYQ